MKVKKYLVLLMAIASSTAFAKHYFNVCYYNQTDSTISYNNDGISKKWLNRGQLVGTGLLAAKESKCFTGIEDETVFSSDYITFYINDKWIGIVNAGFRKPYAITQEATATKGGKLPHEIVGGKDTYTLNIHIVNKNGEVILSGDSDPKVTTSYITPRAFK